MGLLLGIAAGVLLFGLLLRSLGVLGFILKALGGEWLLRMATLGLGFSIGFLVGIWRRLRPR